MKTILIGTTAINRSLLHSQNINDWYNYIIDVNKYSKKYNIRWFINIDFIERLEEDISQTKNNFKNIIKNIPITFVKKTDKKSGNFLQACQNVSTAIEQYIEFNEINEDDVTVLWLEDDWKLHVGKNIPLDELIENYLGNYLASINLSFLRSNYIHALAPSLITYKLFLKLHSSAWKNQYTYDDPESCVGKYFIKNFGKYDDINNITIVNRFKGKNRIIMKYPNSFYTFDIQNEQNEIGEGYIEKNNVLVFIKDKLVFMRVTSSSCADIGREFMKNYDLVKNRQIDQNITNFYKT
jgi:hypothetical protein